MDKKQLHRMLVDTLKADLHAIFKAAQALSEGATHEDAVAKSKYDTHGLELSYLAGAQFERARHSEAKIALLESNPFKSFGEDDEIDVGAVVSLQITGKDGPQTYLVSNLGAGLELTFEGQTIFIVSPESPLGARLITHYEGEVLEARNLPALEILKIQ